MAAAKKNALSKLGWPARIALSIFLMGLPLAGYFTIFHSEIQSEINAAISSNTRLTEDLKKAEAEEAAYRRDAEELKERERNKRELMKVLPVEKEAPAFLASIQNVANLVGVDLQAWVPEAEVREEFYAKVPMRLDLGGHFHQIAKFLYNIGQVERIINMENISITVAPNKGSRSSQVVGSDEVRLKVKVLATAFYATEEVANDEATTGRKRRDRK